MRLVLDTDVLVAAVRSPAGASAELLRLARAGRIVRGGKRAYPLRLPRSIKAAVEKISREEGTSINQFVATAVAEKLAAMDAVAFFEQRRQRADLRAFDALMKRKGGEPPRKGDER